MNDEVDIIEGMFKLLHAVTDNAHIALSSKYLSHKLITSLYDYGAFDNKLNSYDREGDYEFFMKMFNKLNKESISTNQRRKINAIVTY